MSNLTRTDVEHELLRIDNLSAGVDGKIILKHATLSIKKGEIVLLLGPNGSGKSTLAQVILGNPKFKVYSGKILFNGIDITNYPLEKRVTLGITTSFQFPPKIKGLKLREIANEILKKRHVDDPEERIYSIASLLNLHDHLDRDLNVGFSGGEMRRAELFLLFLQAPRFVILDEIDSGVDVESITILAEAIDKMMLTSTYGIIIITHTGLIGKYVKASRAYVMIDGSIICSGSSEKILSCIYTYGFSKCIKKRGRKND